MVSISELRANAAAGSSSAKASLRLPVLSRRRLKPPSKTTGVRFRQRSAELMQHARTGKFLRRRTDGKTACSMYSKLAAAWNTRVGLRHGDKALELDRKVVARTANGRKKSINRGAS